MNERLKSWALGILATVSVAAGCSAINTWADVREMKAKVASQVAAADIEKLRGELNAHEVRAAEVRRDLEQEIADLKAMDSRLWQARSRREGER